MNDMTDIIRKKKWQICSKWSMHPMRSAGTSARVNAKGIFNRTLLLVVAGLVTMPMLWYVYFHHGTGGQRPGTDSIRDGGV